MNPSLRKLFPLGIICVSLALFAAIFQWIIFPLQEKVVEKANAIEAEHVLQANQENRVKELPQLRMQYDFILKNEGVIDTLINHDQVVPFIENIESLASENDVQIIITNRDQPTLKKKPVANTKKNTEGAASTDESVSDTEKKKESITGELPLEKYMSLRFDVRGEYAKVAQFLHQIESLPYAVEVIALDIRQWESDTASTPTRIFSGGGAFLSTNNASVPADKLPSKNLTQALFDVIVYTKD